MQPPTTVIFPNNIGQLKPWRQIAHAQSCMINGPPIEQQFINYSILFNLIVLSIKINGFVVPQGQVYSVADGIIHVAVAAASHLL